MNIYKMAGTGVISFGVLACAVCVLVCRPAPSKASARVSDFDELCRELNAPGSGVIELQRDIPVSGMVSVRGEKILRGRGHCLRRETGREHIYGGVLLCVRGGSLMLQDLVVSGGGEKRELRGRIYGRLLEVRQGNVTVKRGCVLENNSNNGQKTDGGGGVVVKSGAVLRMTGGEIRGNHTAAGGAGVRVETGGRFVMTGGRIVANKAEGVGLVEGFDGRGGAIYNQGRMEFQGGKICYNQASAFESGDGIYGGVGGMLYNAGVCLVTGGRITGNRATQAGGGIYSDRGAKLRVRGGIWSRNRSRKGEDVFRAGRSGVEKPVKEQERQKKNRQTEKPEKTGRKKETESGASEPPGNLLRRKKLTFYEGEYISKNILMENLATDSPEVDAKVKIRTVTRTGRARGWKPDTGECGQGEIIYGISHKGRSFSVHCPYDIRENRPPDIRTAPRYFFVSEVRNYSERQWKKAILDGVKMTDDREGQPELREQCEVDFGGLLSGRPGRYTVRLRVRDQYGSRYYMGEGERRRYGGGKLCQAEVSVVLAEGLSGGVALEDRSIHFEPAPAAVQGEETPEETWRFDREDVERVKEYMGNLENPFSREANDGFLLHFARCREGGEDE